MNCARYRELLTASIDGEVTEIESDLLKDHLGGCPACQNLRSDMRRLQDILFTLGMPPQPGELKMRIRKQLGMREPVSETEPWYIGHMPYRQGYTPKKYVNKGNPNNATSLLGRA